MDHAGGRLGVLRGPTAAHRWLRHLAPVRGALRLRRGALPARQHRVQRRSRGVRAAVSQVDSGRVSHIRLTFACELGADRLSALFSDGSTIEHLQVLGARVALMLSDLSTQRAEVVRKLNEAGIPVVAVPLVPAEDGYYFTADNPSRAAARYEEWKEWTQRHGLVWDGLGLDIEPDVRIYQQMAENPWRVVPILVRNLRDRQRP